MSIYAGNPVALLTQHGKERVIGPVLEQKLGCHVQLVKGYDTDLLGTFTREIPRVGTQREAARKKALIGMELSALPLGISSEGSFGKDPFMGMFPWNLELVMWIDRKRELEIIGVAEGKTNFTHLLTGNWTAAETFARQSKFPEHQLVVRPDNENDPRVRKGISGWPELETTFAWALAQSENGQVFLETDVRAHANPTRMHNILLAVENLAQKLLSLCPVCDTPGFWMVERVAGLPCKDCYAPTKVTRAETQGCLRCPHRFSREFTDRRYADPRFCDNCNP